MFSRTAGTARSVTRILRPPVRAFPLRADLVRLVLELAQDPSGLVLGQMTDGRFWALGRRRSRCRRRTTILVVLVTIASVSGPGVRHDGQRTAVYDDVDRSTHPRTARRPLRVDNGNGRRMPVRRAIAAAAGGRLSSSGGGGSTSLSPSRRCPVRESATEDKGQRTGV